MAISQELKKIMENSSWIRRMFETGNELKKKYGENEVFDFTLGNPTSEPPAKFGIVLKEKVLGDYKGSHRYMSNNGYPETRRAVAKGLSRNLNGEILADNVVMTVGAAGALNITLKALIDKGDEVIYMAPYFPEYRFYIENHGGVHRIVESNEDFSISLDNIAKALNNRTKAIIINTPNNPTGVMYSKESLEMLNSILVEHKEKTGHAVYVISDEPYRKLVYDVKEAPATLDIFADCILCTSHSKDLGLPGERIGFAVVSPGTDDDDSLIKALVFSNRTLGYVNAPALMQRVVAELQDETVDIALYKKKRDLFYSGLKKAGYELSLPEGAFYLFVKSPIENDIEFVNKLLEFKILAVPGSGFGRSGWFRLSYCLDLSTIERSLPLFAKAIN